jgi:NDP-sugar pyrophosphorylase family protein
VTALNAGIIAAGWGERLGKKQPKALTQVAGKALIDYALDGLQAAGAQSFTCIVNEQAGEVPAYVSGQGRPVQADWIIRTTPSSMHSFLIVLERLARKNADACLITTVDSVCPPEIYSEFARKSRLFANAHVVLGLTDFIEDEKPLRVALRGETDSGFMPDRIEDRPEAFEIVAMNDGGFQSSYVTSGFYFVQPEILKEKEAALKNNYTALRQFLGHLLKCGYRIYGVPLPPVMDIDRPEDIVSAERRLPR